MERNSSTNQLIPILSDQDTSETILKNYGKSIPAMPSISPIYIVKSNRHLSHSPTRLNQNGADKEDGVNESFEINRVKKGLRTGEKFSSTNQRHLNGNNGSPDTNTDNNRIKDGSYNGQFGSGLSENTKYQVGHVRYPKRHGSERGTPNKRPPRGCLQKILRVLKVNLLLVLTIVGVALGCILGFSLRSLGLDHDIIELIEFPGTIFMNLIKMLVVPLLVSSVVASISNMEGNTFDRIGLRTLLYFMATTVISVTLGILLSVTIKPGLYYATPISQAQQGRISQTGRHIPSSPDRVSPNLSDDIMDLFRNMFTDNIFRSAFETVRTVSTNVTHSQDFVPVRDDFEILQTKSITSPGNFKYIVIKRLTYSKFPNVLGLITASVATGVVMQKSGPSTRLLVEFFNALNVVLMKLVGIVLWYSPLGIMSLITASILTIEDINSVFTRLGMFVLTVITGLFIHSLIILPLLYAAFTKKNPFRYIRNINQALLTALGTASSAAALPITMDCSENKNRIDVRISRLVLPLGATINMDGTGLYEATVALFVAQVNSIRLSVGQMIAVSLFATSSSVGAAAIPSAGIVTLALVLTAANLPLNDLTFILSVDWLLDRLRTMTNVLGDSIGAGIVAHLSRKDLQKTDPNHESTSISPFRNSLLDDIVENDSSDDTDIKENNYESLTAPKRKTLNVKKTRKHSYHQKEVQHSELV